jgi:hypothetical protein
MRSSDVRQYRNGQFDEKIEALDEGISACERRDRAWNETTVSAIKTILERCSNSIISGNGRSVVASQAWRSRHASTNREAHQLGIPNTPKPLPRCLRWPNRPTARYLASTVARPMVSSRLRRVELEARDLDRFTRDRPEMAKTVQLPDFVGSNRKLADGKASRPGLHTRGRPRFGNAHYAHSIGKVSNRSVDAPRIGARPSTAMHAFGLVVFFTSRGIESGQPTGGLCLLAQRCVRDTFPGSY